MRVLRPNQQGIIVQQSILPKITGMVRPLVGTSPVLTNLDKVIQGEAPRILVSRFSGGIGDVLMTTPSVRAISRKYGCKVDYATDLNYLDGALEKVLRHNPYIDKILSAADLSDIKEDYNAVVDFGCPCVLHERPKAKPVNRIDLFARYVHIQLQDFYLDYVITEEERAWAKEFMITRNLRSRPTILVQPFSSSLRRDAPTNIVQQVLREVIRKQRVNLLVITHDSDNNKETRWDWAEITPLHNFHVRQLAAIIEQVDLIFCPDSAILHLAGALDKKTVTLFGPTDPRARINYYPEAIAVCPGIRLSCFPSWYDAQACNNRCVCWKLLDVQEITDVIFSKLNDTPLPMSENLIFFPKKSLPTNFEQL